MIDINIVRDKNGFIWEFTVKGHAEYDIPGKDIVCAAVSAIALTAIGAMDELIGVKNYSQKKGSLKCTIPLNVPENKKDIIRIILESMVIGFRQIELEPEYSKYLRVLDEEV